MDSETYQNSDRLYQMNTLERLIALNSYGLSITFNSGHTWLELNKDADSPLNLKTVCVNSKFYGGIDNVLDTLDEALRMDGKPTLMDRYNDLHIPSKSGVDMSRISERGDMPEWLF